MLIMFYSVYSRNPGFSVLIYAGYKGCATVGKVLRVSRPTKAWYRSSEVAKYTSAQVLNIP